MRLTLGGGPALALCRVRGRVLRPHATARGRDGCVAMRLRTVADATAAAEHLGLEPHELYSGSAVGFTCPMCAPTGARNHAIVEVVNGLLIAVCDGCDAIESDIIAALEPGAAAPESARRSADRASRGRADIVRVADVQIERIDWLWPGRIPRGKITVLDGDPGLGKSTVTLDWAARLSVGEAMPGEASGREPMSTLLLSAEDGPADTIRPRLEAAGADLEAVHLLRGVPDGAAVLMPEIPRDLEWVEDAIRETRAALVIIDPLFAYLGDKVNARVDHDIRRVLAPLADMADRTHAAVILVRHLNKAPGGPAIYRGGGSIGIIGAARSAMILAAHPEDATRRVIAQTKSNLGSPVPALALRLVSGPADAVARVAWEGPTHHQASDLLRLEDAGERSVVDFATEWLLEKLADGQAHDSAELKALARDEGITARTLSRACGRAAVETRREGFPARTTWSLSEGAASRAGVDGTTGPLEYVARLGDPLNHATSSAPDARGRAQLRQPVAMARLSGSEAQEPARPRDAGMYGPRAPA